MLSDPPPKSRPERLFQQLPKDWNQNLYMQKPSRILLVLRKYGLLYNSKVEKTPG